MPHIAAPHWLALACAALATVIAGVDLWRWRRGARTAGSALAFMVFAFGFLAWALRVRVHR